MDLTLTKRKFLWVGLGIIVLYYFLNKFDFIQSASFGKGLAVSYTRIQFKTNDQVYIFPTVRNVSYRIGEIVPVVYLKDDPTQAYVYSFFGFWYTGMLYCIVPFVLWIAFVLAFVEEDAKLYLTFFGKRKPKSFLMEQKKLSK